uniref:Sialidase domain-containing protein n=1 Tax=Auxenochlorella protothecoides TaxID=3075 RepID=A0A1D2A547_AUXPR
MGAGASTPADFSHKLRHGVIAKELDGGSLGEPSLAVIPQPGGAPLLALAYQVSSLPHQGSRDQYIAFTTSKDGGETWQPHRPVQWGLTPLWAPVLHWDAAGRRLALYYSESRKAPSPGGDIRRIVSLDAGTTWSPPSLVWAHEAHEPVPKVTSSRPVLGTSGELFLAVHLEPQGAHAVFNKDTYSELGAERAAVPCVTAPPGATPPSLLSAAAILVSRDGGDNWALASIIDHPKTWLNQPALEVLSDGTLVALFRSCMGQVFRSVGTPDGSSWSKPGAVALANPNSKLASLLLDDQLLAVHNVGSKDRASLTISLSLTAGRTWEEVVSLHKLPGGVISSPSIVAWSEDTVKVAYSVQGSGLRLTTAQLAVVQS